MGRSVTICGVDCPLEPRRAASNCIALWRLPLNRALALLMQPRQAERIRGEQPMPHGVDQRGEEGTRAVYEGEVALSIAWLVAVARAFRVRETREERPTDELRAAQTDLMRAILLACSAGLTVEDLRSRLIEPALTRPGLTEGAAALLRETLRSVQERLLSA